jgi:hypothetical protein
MSRPSKRFIIIASSILIVAVIFGAVTNLCFKFSRQMENDATYSLLNDLGVFINEKDRMPKNWHEFTEWKGGEVWQSKKLEERFDLPWEKSLSDLNKSENIFSVKTSNLKKSEQSYNNYLKYRVRKSDAGVSATNQ